MIARAYIDDSADGTRQKYVIATAVVGNLRQWRELDKQWKGILKTKPQIKYFHSKEWCRLLGEFRQFTDCEKWPKPRGGEAANAKRDALLLCLEKSALIAIAVAVLIPEYKRVRDTDPRAKLYFSEDAYDSALQSLFSLTAKAIRDLGVNQQVGFVSDRSDKASHYARLYADFKEKNPKISGFMRGIAHLDDKKWPGLQAADLCANIAKTTFDKWDGKDPHVPQKELKPCFYKITYWSERYMKEVLECIHESRTSGITRPSAIL